LCVWLELVEEAGVRRISVKLDVLGKEAAGGGGIIGSIY